MATARQGFSDDWSPGGAAAAAADESLRLEQAPVRSGRRRARCAKKTKLPPQWAGLKFFNVFGPNEYHKGEMMSVLAKRFDEAKAGSPVQLFKSHRAGIADGDQRRDFIYVDDVVAVMLWLLETPTVSRHLQCRHRQGEQLPRHDAGLFAALGSAPNIEYIDMPEAIRGSYQYFTQATVEQSARAGYNGGFTPLEDGGQALCHRLSSTAPTAFAEQDGASRCMFDFEERCGSLPSRRCCASAI